MVGCEYGDRATWCQTYSDLDCSVDHQRQQCCSTCASRTDKPPGSGDGSCPLGDGAHFCSTMPPMDCYYYSDVCCVTCPKHYTGVQGTQLARRSWNAWQWHLLMLTMCSLCGRAMCTWHRYCFMPIQSACWLCDAVDRLWIRRPRVVVWDVCTRCCRVRTAWSRTTVLQ